MSRLRVTLIFDQKACPPNLLSEIKTSIRARKPQNISAKQDDRTQTTRTPSLSPLILSSLPAPPAPACHIAAEKQDQRTHCLKTNPGSSVQDCDQGQGQTEASTDRTNREMLSTNQRQRNKSHILPVVKANCQDKSRTTFERTPALEHDDSSSLDDTESSGATVLQRSGKGRIIKH